MNFLGVFSTLSTIVLLGLLTNAIITFQKLNYNLEFIGTAIFLSFVLVIHLVLVSRSKVKQVVKSNKKKN